MNQRTRKIGFQPRQNKNRQVRFVPALILSGNWLQKAGFEQGQFVTIKIENEQIVIRR